MKLYLDTCCYNRTHDTTAVPRNVSEAKAILEILAAAERKQVTVVSSEAVLIELNAIRDSERRAATLALTSVATETVMITDGITSRTEALHSAGIGRFDALHIACAEAAGCDGFVTTDDRLLKRGGNVAVLKVIDPVDCIEQLERVP